MRRYQIHAYGYTLYREGPPGGRSTYAECWGSHATSRGSVECVSTLLECAQRLADGDAGLGNIYDPLGHYLVASSREQALAILARAQAGYRTWSAR